jgi:hypothetical protein
VVANIDTAFLVAEHNTYANKYVGFIWNILPDNVWTPSQTDFFRPDWTAWKRNSGTTTLIQDIQAHIDRNDSWFALEFDCYACTSRANLRFSETNTSANAIVMEILTDEVMSGDINNDGKIDLKDSIMGLQIAAGIEPSNTVETKGDIGEDGKIGSEEVIYALQKTAGLR